MSKYTLTKGQYVVGTFTIAGMKILDKEKFLKAMYFKNADEIDVNVTDYFIFNSLNLGWLNCDRFYTNTSTSEKIKVKVITNTPDSVDVFLVFSKFNAVIKGRKEGSTFYFNNIPSGEELKVTGLSHGKNKRRLALIHSSTSTKKFILKDFRPFSLSDLDKKLSK